MRRMCDVAVPVNLRQLAQWQEWPLGLVNKSRWVRVTVIESQRHLPVMPFSKDEIGWFEGAPVRSCMMRVRVVDFET